MILVWYKPCEVFVGRMTGWYGYSCRVVETKSDRSAESQQSELSREYHGGL